MILKIILKNKNQQKSSGRKAQSIMKKIITIILVLLTYNLSAQYTKPIFYFGADPNLAINGAYKHDKTPVLHFYFEGGVRFQNQDESVMKVSYANLPESYTSLGLGYNKDIRVFNSEKIRTLIGSTLMYIQRDFQDTSMEDEFVTLELNLKFNYFIFENFGISAGLDGTWRRDSVEYGEKAFFKVFLPQGRISLIILL